MTSPDDTPVFTTGTTYNQPQSSPGFWDKVGSSLGKVASYAREALPYLAQAASNYTDSSSSGNISQDLSNSLTYQPTNTTVTKSTSNPVNYRQIKIDALQAYGANALAKVAEQRAQVDKVAVQQTHQQASKVLDQLANMQGLPTYKEWHAQNGIAYSAPPDPGTLGLAQLQNQTTGNYRIQENQQQIQANLQHGQTPLKYDAWQTAQQQAGPANQDNLLAGFKTKPTSKQQQTTSAQPSSKAQEKSRNVWQNLQLGAVLDDAELNQILHELDLRYYRVTTESEKRQAQLLRLYAEQKQADNMAAQQVSLKPLIADSEEIKNDIPDNLIAESPSISLRYHDTARGEDVSFGERTTGSKTTYPALSLPYSDDKDLALKLYQHFVTGDGQPVEISLNKLNFSKFINAKDLLSAKAREAILSTDYSPENKTKIEHTISNIVGTKVKIDGSKGKITVVEIPALNKAKGLDISPKNPDDIALFAAFGKITVKVKKIDIYINPANKMIFVEGEVEANRGDRLLDRFDFDPANREWYKEALTRGFHNIAPPGSTSFNIFVRKGSHSFYRKNYQLKDFLH